MGRVESMQKNFAISEFWYKVDTIYSTFWLHW